MTTPATQLTKEDLAKLVSDSVEAAVAKRMNEAAEKAADAHRKRELDGDLKGLDVTQQIARAFAEEKRKGFYFHPRAQGDRARGIVEFDPHEGRGAVIGRLARVFFLAQKGEGRPADIAKRIGEEQKSEDYLALSRGLLETNFSGMGALIPPEMSAEIIEFLYPAVVCQAMGARTVPFKSNLIFGKQNQTAVAYYVGEAANVTPSQPGFGQLELKARKSAALAILSNDLLRNPNIATDMFVRDDIVRVMALKRDLSILRGAGTLYTPKGIRNWTNAANVNPSAGTTLADKVADLIGMINQIDSSDVPLDRGGFVMAPRSKWSLAATLNSLGLYVFWPMIAQGELYGFPIKTTTQIPINLGGGGADSEIYFGQWPEVIVGEDLPLEVELFLNGAFFDGANQVSGISSDQSVLRALDRHDVIMRHDKAFSVLTTVQWT